MSANIIHEVMAESQAGKLIFPEVVRRLVEAGVESYFIDFSNGNEAFYLRAGGSHIEKMTIAPAPVAEEFSSSGIVAAIKSAQTDQIRYPEFVKQATAAGVVGYWAFLAGKKVIYFGRKGEIHVEEFPRAKQ